MGSDRRARRGLRALVIVTIATTAIVTASASVAGAAPTRTQRAQQGAQWLANQIHKNGGFVKTGGVADPVDTAYAVIGMRAAGVDKPDTDLAVKYLETKIGTPLQLGGKDSAGALADYIMAAVADGLNPHHFGGTAAKNDLVTRLFATQRTTGADTGLFGSQAPTYDGAFRQGLALAALKIANAHATDPRVVSAIAWLTKQQCANGLWEAYRANTAVACPAADPNTFTGPDTNSTALAAQGLAAWAHFPRKTTLLQALQNVESSDAGFPFVAAKNQASDPDSTALVIQTLTVEGSSPNATTWTKGTHTPFTALAGYQLGCKSADFGAFFFPGSTAGNVFATAQAVPAMMGKPLPIAASTASTIVKLTRC